MKARAEYYLIARQLKQKTYHRYSQTREYSYYGLFRLQRLAKALRLLRIIKRDCGYDKVSLPKIDFSLIANLSPLERNHYVNPIILGEKEFIP